MASQNLPSLSLSHGKDSKAINMDDFALFDDVLTRRCFAYLIDVVILAIIMGLAMIVMSVATAITLGLFAPFKVAILVLMPLAYHTFFIGRYGATLGMSFMDLEVRTTEGRPIDFVQAALMTILFYVSIGVTGLIILIVSFFNDKRRTMHDYFSDSVVVRSGAAQRQHGQDPFAD
ncbi:RDD family protein [Rhodovibrionaceae bacterium A322]